MANKRALLLWTILCAACLAGALATLAVGVVFAVQVTHTGMLGRNVILFGALAAGLTALSAGCLVVAWRRLRH